MWKGLPGVNPEGFLGGGGGVIHLMKCTYTQDKKLQAPLALSEL